MEAQLFSEIYVGRLQSGIWLEIKDKNADAVVWETVWNQVNAGQIQGVHTSCKRKIYDWPGDKKCPQRNDVAL